MEIGPISTASRDFRRARRKADLQEIVARLTGKPVSLLSFEEVRQKLKIEESGKRTLEEIPLDAIVGSVGRYKDFTRKFLPRLESDKERWARVKASVEAMGHQPIDVYKVGEVYFVLDGHHRVSVARQIGATTITANVIEVHTRVPLSPEDQLDDLIIKAEYADFLEKTRLDKFRPEADIRVTAPGRYKLIEEQIQIYRYILSQKHNREIPYRQAVTKWYDEIYLPVVQVIQERGILRDFPGRTEADLYLWVSKHHETLEKELGWRLDPEKATAELVDRFSLKPKRVISRASERIKDALIPDELEAGPEPGEWRQQRRTTRQDDILFSDILVAVNGKETGWRALEQALILAQYEGAFIHGLHVAPSKARLKSQAAKSLSAEFDRRCKAAGVTGNLVFEFGRTPRKVCNRSRWVDLVALSISHPPAPRAVSRLSSGLSTLIRRCPRPLLAVPDRTTRLSRALLAYDGSPKSQEALYVAAYMATRCGTELVVVNIMEPGQDQSEVLTRARSYLEKQGTQAFYAERDGVIAEEILKTSQAHECDLIIMGGYGFDPLMEIVLGSAVDEVLRTSRLPMLICR